MGSRSRLEPPHFDHRCLRNRAASVPTDLDHLVVHWRQASFAGRSGQLIIVPQQGAPRSDSQYCSSARRRCASIATNRAISARRSHSPQRTGLLRRPRVFVQPSGQAARPLIGLPSAWAIRVVRSVIHDGRPAWERRYSSLNPSSSASRWAACCHSPAWPWSSAWASGQRPVSWARDCSCSHCSRCAHHICASSTDPAPSASRPRQKVWSIWIWRSAHRSGSCVPTIGSDTAIRPPSGRRTSASPSCDQAVSVGRATPHKASGTDRGSTVNQVGAFVSRKTSLWGISDCVPEPPHR